MQKTTTKQPITLEFYLKTWHHENLINNQIPVLIQSDSFANNTTYLLDRDCGIKVVFISFGFPNKLYFEGDKEKRDVHFKKFIEALEAKTNDFDPELIKFCINPKNKNCYRFFKPTNTFIFQIPLTSYEYGLESESDILKIANTASDWIEFLSDWIPIAFLTWDVNHTLDREMDLQVYQILNSKNANLKLDPPCYFKDMQLNN